MPSMPLSDRQSARSLPPAGHDLRGRRLLSHARWATGLAIAVGVAIGLGLGAMAVSAQPSTAAPDPDDYNGFDVGNASVPLSAIQRGGPPKDGIPAIDRPKFVPAAQSGLSDGDRVLGMALNGIARAYPVRILNWHEVVNDRFGERAVAVTYCPLCGTGMAFDSPIAASAGAFAGVSAGASSAGLGVSGLLYNSDVLLYDRATHSLWSQIMQTAVSGPRKGARLTALPLTHTSWADWRQRHPSTQVLSTETGFVRDYQRDPYATYASVPQLMFDVQHRDERFAPKEWVLGLEVNGAHKAYPFSALAKAVDARGELKDSLGGQSIRVRHDRLHGTAEAFDSSGRPIASTMAFWFAWVAFHPRTEVLRAP